MQKSIKNAIPTSDKNQNFAGLDCADGSTAAASIRNRTVDPSKRSIVPLVLSIVSMISKQLDLEEAQCILVESLIWPFVAKRSLRKEPFSILELHKFKESMLITATRIKKYTDLMNNEQVFIKYWLDVYMCQVFRDDQRPPKKEWIKENLFSGWCKRFIARAIAKQDVSFIFSLNKGSKRLWPELGDAKKLEAFEKHKERLCSDHGSVPQDLRSIIQVTSMEIFSSINRPENSASPTKCVPSGSACLQVSRLHGGTLKMMKPFDLESILDSEDSKKVGKLRTLHQAFSKWTNDTYRFAHDRALKDDIIDIPEFREPGGKLISRSERIVYGPYDLVAVAVPEPSKFRMITKGNGYLYTALQPLQGLMLDAWKKQLFSTMRDEDLTEKVNRIHKNCHMLDTFYSVDYEAATDLVKKDATINAFKVLKYVVDYDLALQALLGIGTIQYPKGGPSPGVVIDGQLMGHPLSFPLLCVLNLATFRCALVRYVSSSENPWQYEQRKFIARLMACNVIVNGDDMFFKGPRDFYEIFTQTATDIGFKLSIGKNYLSKSCCMINSQVFKLNKNKNILERQGYLNLKFINTKVDETASPTQIGKELNKMIGLCPWTESIIPAVFARRWKGFEFHDRGHQFTPNWFLPVHLGGYGIDRRYAPTDLKITRDQRKLARVFLKDIKLQLFIRSPDSNMFLRKLDTSSFLPGLLNFTVTDPFRPLNQNETEDQDPWLGRLSLFYNMSNSQTDRDEKRDFYTSLHFDLSGVKPFTLEKIDRLNQIKLIAKKSADLPSLCPITILRPITIFRSLMKHLPFGKC